MSVTLPKGTKERIEALGLSANGLINRLVLAEMYRLEAEQEEALKADGEPPF